MDDTDKLKNPDQTSRFPSATCHAIFWPIVIFGVIADLWSKYAVHNWLLNTPEYKKVFFFNGNEFVEYKKVFIDGYFSFIVAFNDGAAFSILAGKQGFLVGISAVAMVVVVCIFLFGKINSKMYVISLGLFLAGIIGNLYDRATEGLVRDFIDVHYKEVYHWPAFNIADSMLCTAVGLMIIMQFGAFQDKEVPV